MVEFNETDLITRDYIYSKLSQNNRARRFESFIRSLNIVTDVKSMVEELSNFDVPYVKYTTVLTSNIYKHNFVFLFVPADIVDKTFTITKIQQAIKELGEGEYTLELEDVLMRTALSRDDEIEDYLHHPERFLSEPSYVLVFEHLVGSVDDVNSYSFMGVFNGIYSVICYLEGR